MCDSGRENHTKKEVIPPNYQRGFRAGGAKSANILTGISHDNTLYLIFKSTDPKGG